MHNTISKEEIKELPLKQFEGTVTIIEDPRSVEQMVQRLMKEKVIGFDTETKPAFKKGVSHHVALLQLSTSKEAFLFRLNQTGFTDSLIQLLASPAVLKVGVGIRDDLRGLQRLRPFTPGGFIELQEMVTRYGIEVFSLKSLAALLLNVRISKRQRLSNWESPELQEAQAVYAATDAWIALKIYQKLTKMLPLKKVAKPAKAVSQQESR